MKKYFLILLLIPMFISCEDDNKDTEVYVSFLLENELLWHIGHNYNVSCTDETGAEFIGTEKYIQYIDILLDNRKIKYGTKVNLLRDGTIIWTSEAITSSCAITYHDTPYSGGDWANIE